MKKRHSVSIFLFVLFALFGLSLVDSNIYDITGKVLIYGADCNGCTDIDYPHGILEPYTCSDTVPWYCDRYEEVPGSDFWSCELIMNCQVCGCSFGLVCGDDGGCIPETEDPDLPNTKTHSECVEFGDGEYFYCLEVTGSGENECSVDDDCYDEDYIWHSECWSDGNQIGGQEGQEGGPNCRSVLGPGRHECYLDIDECLPEFLNRCDDYTWEGDCFWGSRPMYCEDGNPVDNCQVCGCPSSGSDDFEYECAQDGSCELIFSPDAEIDDLLEFRNLTISAQSRISLEELFGQRLFYALQFKRYEKPLAIKFISPYLFKVTQNLPPKPDLEIKEDSFVNENSEGVQMGPPKDVIVITGLAALPDGVFLSPGEREEEFSFILNVENGVPQIGLQL